MTIEQIELRKILTQMLADNGINRETIKDVVKEIVEEKVEKTLSHLIANGDGNFEDKVTYKVERLTSKFIEKEISQVAMQAIREQVKGYFNNISVSVTLCDPNGKHRRTTSTSF